MGANAAFKWAKHDGLVMPLCPYHLRATKADSIKGDGVYICGLCSPDKAIVIIPSVLTKMATV